MIKLLFLIEILTALCLMALHDINKKNVHKTMRDFKNIKKKIKFDSELLTKNRIESETNFHFL